MRLMCFIDNLASGGAQRQMINLATWLKKRGVDVEFITYHPEDFFAPLLDQAEIRYRCIQEPGKLSRNLAIRDVLRRNPPDVVLSFLQTPNVIAEFSALPWRRFGLVVSERNTYVNVPLRKFWFKTLLHRVADAVVTNSHTNRLVLQRHAPWLAKSLVTIYNSVDLEHFRPGPSGVRPKNHVRLLGVGQFVPQKNLLGLVEAMALVRQRYRDRLVILHWTGDDFRSRSTANQDQSRYFEKVQKRIRKLGLMDRVRLNSPTSAILDEYRMASAVILPSHYEGLPNVVCEAMACGSPILTSNVCDAGNLVQQGRNGLLFDPNSPDDMADAIIRFSHLGLEERRGMGSLSRALAEERFHPEGFVDHYQSVLEHAALRRSPARQHWPADVPTSAFQTAGKARF